MISPWVLVFILCVCQYIIAVILFEHQNKTRFLLNQTYST
jgi:hypothetical protein